MVIILQQKTCWLYYDIQVHFKHDLHETTVDVMLILLFQTKSSLFLWLSHDDKDFSPKSVSARKQAILVQPSFNHASLTFGVQIFLCIRSFSGGLKETDNKLQSVTTGPWLLKNLHLHLKKTKTKQYSFLL